MGCEHWDIDIVSIVIFDKWPGLVADQFRAYHVHSNRFLMILIQLFYNVEFWRCNYMTWFHFENKQWASDSLFYRRNLITTYHSLYFRYNYQIKGLISQDLRIFLFESNIWDTNQSMICKWLLHNVVFFKACSRILR